MFLTRFLGETVIIAGISRVQKVLYKNQNWLSLGEECHLHFPENLALLSGAQNKTCIQIQKRHSSSSSRFSHAGHQCASMPTSRDDTLRKSAVSITPLLHSPFHFPQRQLTTAGFGVEMLE